MTSESQRQLGNRTFPSFVMDNVFRRVFRPPEKLVSKYVRPGSVVADLGCGPGYYTLPIAKIVVKGSGGKVYAIDFDQKAIERLRGKARKLGFEGTIESRATSASDIDFIESASVDFVLGEGLICCMKDHAGAIRQINRILKPEGSGGRAYLSISKFARKRDPRSVAKEEWETLLTNFRVKDRGEALTAQWALVSRSENKRGSNQQ